MDDRNGDRPIAPETVYKYVVADRIDVLRNANIRFTPPLNTNDIFEVRQTIEMLAGPKMEELFAEQAKTIDINQSIAEALKDTPLAGMSPEVLKQLFQGATGDDFESSLQSVLGLMLKNAVLPAMNSPQAIDDLLTKLGSDLICLSLSDRFDISPMWAHYAGNSTGFVIAFNTKNGFFRRGEEGERQGLQKITYFDGKLPEVMDDPYAALISKQKDWAYEREWRLYLKADQASDALKIGEETIHLVNFPRDAVQRVILGTRVSNELASSIKSILTSDYPHAPLTRVRADRATASLTEILIA